MEAKNLKLLAIDDNPDNLTALGAVLRDARGLVSGLVPAQHAHEGP